ncbi:MAG: hypothetical protein PHW04_06150 [Candidatus Wallbacteria bacterium]|nr:hypothetical protein [Candidatus Wallbacteria bacterium]
MGFLNHDPELEKNGQLSFSTLSLFRLLELLTQEGNSLDGLKNVISNWVDYRSRLHEPGGQRKQLVFFPAAFISLFLYYRNFPLLLSTFGRLLDCFAEEGISEEDVRNYYSLCLAAYKTRSISLEFDEEAFLFYLLNNESANSEAVQEKKDPSFISSYLSSGTTAEKLSASQQTILNLLSHFKHQAQNPSELPERLWSGFLEGIFSHQSLTVKPEAELEEFIVETVDNFWCLINEGGNDLSL